MTLTTMFTHTLNALKGWPAPHALDFKAPISAGEASPVYPGTVMSLDAAGELVRGVGTAAVMPLFLFPTSTDPDIVNDGGDPATDKRAWTGYSPSGGALCLVATGGYELVSTEIAAGEDADSLVPNAHLTSADNGADAGKLSVGTPYTDTIVGVVSRGVVDSYGETAVAFWSYYLPG